MALDRLTALDASFLHVETTSAHMHVGWAALFEPPEDLPRPSFEQLRDHIASRLSRAPRYRQRLAPVPLGVARPVWVDDERFDVDRHLKRSSAGSLAELAGVVMSTPLARSRPLWEMWIADRLDDGRVGVVCKAHHCMVDGIAAVELAALLLDPTPDPAAAEPDGWRPAPAPGAGRLLVDAVIDRTVEQLQAAGSYARAAASPARAVEGLQRTGRALAHSLSPAQPVGALNDPISPYRSLSTLSRPLDELRHVKRAFGATINDVVLAVAAGGVRRFLERRGESAPRLKAMVPVNVRSRGAAGELGNRISFLFMELPCDEPDPRRRLRSLALTTAEAKAAREPEGATAVLDLAARTPSPVQRMMSRLVASPRTFNVVVSNIPGPQEPLYMRGCRLREAYPVVPLADRHALSIGFTSVDGGAFFGVYADRDSIPDADRLATDLGAALDELMALVPPERPRSRPREPALV
ncbi:MAG TPA: wax ester/triacylglycerol synthase family O-acyltransferase [Thermoleophilaceae bacterium]